MAVDTAPKLRRVQNLACATEVTTGTPISLSASNGTIQIFNPQMPFSTEAVERESQGALSPIQQARGARPGKVTFECEVVGYGSSGSLPLWMTVLLAACGTQINTGVVTPLTNSIATITLGLYINGRFKLLSGCAGNAVFTFARGKPGRVAFAFDGVQQETTDTTQIIPTYVVTPIAPRVGASFTFATVPARVSDIVFDLGNTVVMREDVGAVDSNSQPTGYRCAIITSRKPTIKFAPEALPTATLDIYALERNSTLSAFSLQVGSTANNMFTFAAPKTQIIESPQDGDRNGLYIDQLTLLCTRNSSAGDDEWSLTAA